MDDLLADVIAAPDDDAPRLVYADALISRGDPRGELIRLQIDGVGEPEGLLAAHEESWLAPIRRHLQGWKWKRGFLDEVRVREADWHAGAGAEILAAHPVRKVEIMYARAPEKLPELARIRVLSLPDAGLGVDHVKRLAKAAPKLRGLWLEENPIGDDGVAALASFKELEELELKGCAFGPQRAGTITAKGWAALVKAPFVPTLKLLGLRANNFKIVPEALETIVSAKLAVHTLLDLSWNFDGVRAGKKAAAVLASASLPSLKLDVTQNHFPDEALAKLGAWHELVDRWRL
jgi:uncharacterized protein (TIGR02996 family)